MCVPHQPMPHLKQLSMVDTPLRILGHECHTEVSFVINESTETAENHIIKDLQGNLLFQSVGSVLSNKKIIYSADGQELGVLKSKAILRQFKIKKNYVLKGKFRYDFLFFLYPRFQGKFKTIEGHEIKIYLKSDNHGTYVYLSNKGKERLLIAKSCIDYCSKSFQSRIVYTVTKNVDLSVIAILLLVCKYALERRRF